MSYQEKNVIISMVSSLLILACYCLYVYYYHNAEIMAQPTNFRFWGKTILVFIALSIGIRIAILILFAIVNAIITREKDPGLSDERDKLIELKSMRNSHWLFSLGFIVAMVALAYGAQPYWMFIIIIASGFVSEMVDSFSKLYYYRKGI